MNTVGSLKVKNWGLWLVFGIILMLLGFFLLASPIVASIASVVVFGGLLIAAGVVHAITALVEKNSEHRWIHLVIAAFTLVIGFLILASPAVTLATLTILIAAFLLSSGLFNIIGGLVYRFKGWGWYILNGVIGILLGVLILIHWPTASLWVIGLFLGIDFLFAGLSLIMIALFVKKRSLLA
ncbi:MAG: HdeD family acid-resistance protein [Gammaproteobacteria bacterium]|nr:HdeD family acid-resistance protein [Gammaproteobacteria bacterium]